MTLKGKYWTLGGKGGSKMIQKHRPSFMGVPLHLCEKQSGPSIVSNPNLIYTAFFSNPIIFLQDKLKIFCS